MAVVFSKEEQVNLLLSGHNLNNSTSLEPEFTNEAHIPHEEISHVPPDLKSVCLKSVEAIYKFHERTDVAV